MSDINLFAWWFVVASAFACVVCITMPAAISGWLGKWGQLTIGHNYQYDEGFDRFVCGALDQLAYGRVGAHLTDFDVVIGDSELWIEDKFYGYCSRAAQAGRKAFDGKRVSYRTAMRLYRLEQYLKANGPISAGECWA